MKAELRILLTINPEQTFLRQQLNPNELVLSCRVVVLNVAPRTPVYGQLCCRHRKYGLFVAPGASCTPPGQIDYITRGDLSNTRQRFGDERD